jgi:hypothetical protein
MVKVLNKNLRKYRSLYLRVWTMALELDSQGRVKQAPEVEVPFQHTGVIAVS